MFSRGDFEDCITASKVSERPNANGSMEHSPPLWLLVLRPCRLAKRLQTPPKILVRSLSLHLERRQERHGIQIGIPCWRRTRHSWLNRQRWINIPKSAIRTKAQQSIWRHPGWELSRRVDQEQLYNQYLRKKSAGKLTLFTDLWWYARAQLARSGRSSCWIWVCIGEWYPETIVVDSLIEHVCNSVLQSSAATQTIPVSHVHRIEPFFQGLAKILRSY